MIKINLLAEKKKQARKTAPGGLKLEGLSTGRNFLLIGILLVGVAVGGGWWWIIQQEVTERREKIAEADRELERLKQAIKKGQEYEAQKALLARKIELITNLKKQQAVPVHILDQVSRSLPEFLWLDSMTASSNQISISGKATNYNAVSNFYSNLTQSGFFKDVSLGRTFEVPEGVSFSLTCSFAGKTEGERAQS